ncbi:MAG: 30S ribosomal protein S21 [Alphaproteobacteria bacterium]|nr:30S ribosomal protein S21 [Alphaproteobacteria bacterium]MBL0717773.1 30S ribosomal protein S21 [Alphaproteobacteria bacterium]
MVKVVVRDNNVDAALRVLGNIHKKEGIYRLLKGRARHIKPTEVRKLKREEAVRRAKKDASKRRTIFGF